MSPHLPPPLDSERWSRIEALFHEASELPEAERTAFLVRACGDDDELRRSVERFLAADAAERAVIDGSLEELATPLLTGGSSAHGQPLEPGTKVGRYRVIDVLGSGGMGTVYRAERADGAYEREVAIKLVRTGRLDADAERRFQRERQILARLSHPGIATLLDGDVTDEGQALLVMELVEGEAITEYARRRDLDLRGRVRLVIQIADAVDYAHRNLVVHRDLKPSNILVRESGEVKLLDFGIARLMEEDTEDSLTRTGLFLLTPEYAAPEQIRGEAITTATDVYGIGAIAYELLALERPFGRVTPKWSDLERVLRESPAPLSRAEGLDRATRRALDGDLDTIVQKALRKDPQRRYASARDLGDDLQRYLDGLPVTARRDSVGYRFGKFVGRNRAASATAAALIVAVALGAFGTLWQAREARLQAERGEAVGDFLFSLFEGADPDLNPGESVTALELLEAGLARVDSLDAGPEMRVDLLTTLGVLFGKIGHYDRSDALLTRAVADAKSTLPPSDPALGDALDALGIQLSLLGDLEQAERVLHEALEARQSNGASPIEVASTQGNLALTLRRRGRYEEAAALYGAAIATLEREMDGDSVGFASELMGLGQVYQFQDRPEDAEALFRTVLRLKEDAGAEEPFVAHAIHNLGVVLADQSRYGESEQVHFEALATWRGLFPGGHPEIARSYEAIARVVAMQSRWSEADSLYREAVDRWSEQYGDEHTQIAAIRANQANLRYFAGDFDAAAEAYRDGIRIWRSNDERRLLGIGLRNLGIIERERRDYESADTLLAAALQLRRELNGDVHTSVAEVHSAIAGLRNQQGRHQEAEGHARTAVEQYDALLEPRHRLIYNASLELGVAIAGQGRFADARPVLEPVFVEFSETRNEADAHLGRAGLWLGICLAGLGEADRARELIEGALPSLSAGLAPDAPDRLRAERELARLEP